MLRRSAAYLLFAALTFSAIVSFANADEFIAVEHQRQTIYHSPQTPGYTCWVGAWTMPDNCVMVSFTQATGPVAGRPHAPEDVQKRLNWPPPGMPAYDMTGLDMCNVHLRSVDGGKTWEQVSADPFKSCMNGVTGGPETVLPNGTLLRGVWGNYLPYNPELPQTGYVQRSSDGSKTWGKPDVLLDPNEYWTFPKRIRVLRDGRIIVIGGVVPIPANSRGMGEILDLLDPLLIVSTDKGLTWSKPIPVVPDAYRSKWGGEEYDVAELPNGDLLCVFRRMVPETKKQERWQGLLKKSRDSWTPSEVGPAPFPHSGHPELLATREGPILHLATSGIHYTNDAGKTWQVLDAPGTAYYPRAVQTPDGRIFVFAHIGSDDAYGAVDQSIVMDSFLLKKK